MNTGIIIARLRHTADMTQEKFAEMLGVSRQAVQKWETGMSLPDIRNIVMIAKLFNVSIDTLLLGRDQRSVEEMPRDQIIRPGYENMHEWDLYSKNMSIEYRQCIAEGKDVSGYRKLFEAVAEMPANGYQAAVSDIVFDIVRNAPQAEGYAYDEPSDLAGIQARRPITDIKWGPANPKPLEKQIYGAWMGRICGCLLGKPIEGIRRRELYPLLKESGNWPMHRYITSADITEEMCREYDFPLRDRCWADCVSCGPVDDDTNYTVMASELIERYGRDFLPGDVAKLWVALQPKHAYCTAERVAYRNIVNGYCPPDTAVLKNPYREWIGAQIRGDYFGYINPGDPETAAEMAWRDASISHVKNGIYGEMFVAAMLACAAVCDDMEQVVLGGIAQIPQTSRMYAAIMEVIGWYRSGESESGCFQKFMERYDEDKQDDWCHAISNAIIVVIALLYGNGDYGKSICGAVQACFDTDCNGATVGSIVGMAMGIDAIPSDWKRPIGDILDTSIFGVGKTSITALVERTCRHIEK